MNKTLNVFLLSDLAEIVTGGTPSSAEPEAWGDHLDFITPSDQETTSREAVPARRLSEAGEAMMRRIVVPAHSTQLTCIGSTIGKVTRATRSCVTNQQINTLIARQAVCDPGFLYYRVRLWAPELKSMASGSATPIVNRSVLSRVEFDVPTLPTQRAIAEVLGALDDKIAANGALAEASRKLRAVSLIRAQAFGAEIARLGAVTSVLTRGKAPRYVEDGSAVLAVNQKCVRNGAVSLKPARLAAALREPRLVFGDVLINSTGRGTLGRVGIWRENVSAFPDSHVTVARFDSVQVDPWVGAEALLALEPEIESMGEGSTGQTELGRKALAELEIKLPSPDIQAALSQQLLALHLREQQAVAESVRLAELRDTLLPHLMSGRLTVRQAEKQVEEVL